MQPNEQLNRLAILINETEKRRGVPKKHIMQARIALAHMAANLYPGLYKAPKVA